MEKFALPCLFLAKDDSSNEIDDQDAIGNVEDPDFDPDSDPDSETDSETEGGTEGQIVETDNESGDTEGDQDAIGEHDEQIVKGETVTLSGPYRRDNPDFDEEQEVSETNKKTLSYYIVTEYEGHYRVVLDADCKSGEWTTFTIKDSDGNSVTMAASGQQIRAGHFVSKSYIHSTDNAPSYDIERSVTNEGPRLVIVGGPCTEEVEDEAEETETA